MPRLQHNKKRKFSRDVFPIHSTPLELRQDPSRRALQWEDNAGTQARHSQGSIVAVMNSEATTEHPFLFDEPAVQL